MARDYFLQTDRTIASLWTAGDIALAEQLWGNPLVTALFAPKGGFTKAQIAQRLALEMQNQTQYGYAYWPVFEKEADRFIGCAGFRPYDVENRVLEFGIHLLPAAWGNGYAGEIGRALLAYAITDLGAENIFAGHHPENQASKKMLIKLGFHYIKNEFYKPTGLYHPSYFYK